MTNKKKALDERDEAIRFAKRLVANGTTQPSVFLARIFLAEVTALENEKLIHADWKKQAQELGECLKRAQLVIYWAKQGFRPPDPINEDLSKRPNWYEKLREALAELEENS